MSDTFKQLAGEMLPALDLEMRSVLGNKEGERPDLFHGMMHYHMGWVDADLNPAHTNNGKRIRPLMCMISAAAAGGDWQQAVPAAAAIEIVHNFSLVHDDIEDASDTRRGRLTVWKLWGVAQAINCGDAMFALSHLAMNRLAQRSVPAEVTVQALRRFDETCMQLTQGQHADMAFESRALVSVDEYMKMITGKTAVLVSLCTELGARIAQAPPEIVEHYRQFGLKLGLAFQVIDDILGIWGNETVTGKSTATDITTKKKTLPVLYGLEHSAALRELYAQNDEPDHEFVQQVVALLDESGARTYAEAEANTYSESALKHLQQARPTGTAAAALHELADMLLKRRF